MSVSQKCPPKREPLSKSKIDISVTYADERPTPDPDVYGDEPLDDDLVSKLKGGPRLVRLKVEFLEFLKASMGNVTVACQNAKCSRRNYYYWRDDDTEFALAADEAKDIAIDYVEQQLLKNVKAGNVAAQIFYLKTIGKSRGYNEKPHFTISGPNDGPIHTKTEASPLAGLSNEEVLAMAKNIISVSEGRLPDYNSDDNTEEDDNES